MELASSKKGLIVVAVSIVLIAIVMFSYFYFFTPLEKKIAQAEEQLKLEEKLLEAIQSQKKQQSIDISPYELQTLQKQVPVRPLVDQFIFDLEKAEIFSDSFILNYGFGEGQFSGNDILLDDEEQVEETSNTSGSERITVNMSVTTPGYEELIDFLENIEQLERITKIDQLSFTGNPEVTMVEQTADDINFALTISTFYLPELEQFSQYLPKINYPEQENRYNPLYDRVDRQKTDN